MNRRVVGVVLAAGQSTRMGRFKQLLPFGEATVVETVVGRLRAAGPDDVVVVLGHRADEVRAVLSGVRCVVNADYARGMFSSVLTALDAVGPEADGMLLLLGDQPQIREDVISAVLARFRESGKGIVIPEVRGSRGHPVAIDVGRYGEEIRGLDGSEGLKPVVRGHPEDTELVRIEDESILRDLDTPEDYARELEHARESHRDREGRRGDEG